jgi:hypothetical protein
MPEPAQPPDEQTEPQMTSAEIDDIEVWASPDQLSTPDLTGLSLDEEADR